MADFLWICIRDGFNLGLAIRVQMRRKADASQLSV
jgi:hypothetical protein